MPIQYGTVSTLAREKKRTTKRVAALPSVGVLHISGGSLSGTYSYVQVHFPTAHVPAWDLTSGSLTPAPEPSIWVLLAVVLLSLGALLLFGERFGRRRAVQLNWPWSSADPALGSAALPFTSVCY